MRRARFGASRPSRQSASSSRGTPGPWAPCAPSPRRWTKRASAASWRRRRATCYSCRARPSSNGSTTASPSRRATRRTSTCRRRRPAARGARRAARRGRRRRSGRRRAAEDDARRRVRAAEIGRLRRPRGASGAVPRPMVVSFAELADPLAPPSRWRGEGPLARPPYSAFQLPMSGCAPPSTRRSARSSAPMPFHAQIVERRRWRPAAKPAKIILPVRAEPRITNLFVTVGGRRCTGPLDPASPSTRLRFHAIVASVIFYRAWESNLFAPGPLACRTVFFAKTRAGGDAPVVMRANEPTKRTAVRTPQPYKTPTSCEESYAGL